MPNQEKLFVCVKNGWAMNFSPIGLAGWRALGWWTLSLLPIIGVFLSIIATGPSPVVEAVIGIAFLAVLGLWTWAMIRWMLPRSDVIDANELLELKRERDRQKSRHGRPPRHGK
jgi:hypothetical protein